MSATATVGFATIMGEREQAGRVLHEASGEQPKVETRDFSFWYGATQALFGVTMKIPERRVTALVAPQRL